MRFSPPAIALSLLALLSASVGHSAPPVPLDPQAYALVQAGRAAAAAGDFDHATDALEAALAVQPGNPAVLLDLAMVARRQGMQGKALHYYRAVLTDDPQDVAGLAGEGAALAEKGALDKARRNLAQIQSLCGGDCPPARELAAVIARGPATPSLSAADVTPHPVVSAN